VVARNHAGKGRNRRGERGRQNGRLLQGKASIDFSKEIDRLGFHDHNGANIGK
jgi:hypothetical protein